MDVVIVGGGPAGLSAGVEAAAAGLEHIVLEKGKLMQTLLDFYPKEKPVVMNWHGVTPVFEGIMRFEGTDAELPAEQFIERCNRYAQDANVQMREGVEVSSVRPCGAGYLVTTSDASYDAKHVILALGVFGRPKTLPQWEGERSGIPQRLRGKAVLSLKDPDAVSGLDVLIAGGGDSAVEDALRLCSRNNVSISYRQADFGRRLLPENNAAAIECVRHGHLTTLFGTNITAVDLAGERLAVTLNGSDTREYDRLVVRFGGTTPLEFLAGCGVRCAGSPKAKPVLKDSLESADCPGLYVIGDLAGVKDAIVVAIQQGVRVIRDIR